jgi:K+-transporting ATPase ATPase C chain
MSQIKQALVVFLSLSVLCGLIYPLFMTVVAQGLFPHPANGSPVTADSRVVGSELIGQRFEDPKYFHGRPSATEPAYNAGGSAGSNLGPSSARLMEQVAERMKKVRQENGLTSRSSVPADLVTASASGLDPHISPASAMLQVPRVARERRMPESEVKEMIVRHTEGPLLGIWGRERINVLKLNMALDRLTQGH